MKTLFQTCLLLTFLFWSFITSGQDVKTKPVEVKIIPDTANKKVEVWMNNQLFTAYIFPNELKKPVLFPLKTASGISITRGFPLDPKPGERIDHPHHVGMWFNHGDVNGHDFWNNSNDIGPEHKGPFGTIFHKSIQSIKSGIGKGELVVLSEWKDSFGKTLIVEETRFIFEGTTQDRTIIRETKLTCEDKPVLFKDNKEGMFALRVARALEHPSQKPEIFLDAKGKKTSVPMLSNEGVTGKYLSSQGHEGESVWGKQANWVSLQGKINEEPVNVVIFDNPQNPGYPSYWHARGYGLFSVNPLGRKVFSEGKEALDFSLMPKKAAIFRHKVVIHAGEPFTHEELNRMWTDFSAK